MKKHKSNLSKEEKVVLKRQTKNLFFTAIVMGVFIYIGLFTVLCVLVMTGKTTAVHEIFMKNVWTVLLCTLGLTIFFTFVQFYLSRAVSRQPIRDFIKALNKVIDGDYSTRIDIEKIKLNDLQFIVIADSFNKMTESLGTVETLSNDFIANVSHEMKTPLAVIQSYATLIQNPELSDEEKHEYVLKIVKSSQQLSSLVTNILRLNKIENKKIVADMQTYNLSNQLAQSLLSFEQAWDEKNLNITYEVDDDILVESDEELFSIVWANLLSNAIKFSSENGELKVKAFKKVKGFDDDSDDYVQVEITDSGKGMSEDTQKHIFEKFYQGDTSHTSIGNGLGLTLVKRIIDITGNKIFVNSELGKGTTFTVRIFEKKKKIEEESLTKKLLSSIQE